MMLAPSWITEKEGRLRRDELGGDDRKPETQRWERICVNVRTFGAVFSPRRRILPSD